jgi:hypothetical protein
VTSKITEETIVGTIHAVPYRLHYGPGKATLALRHNNMVIVSAITYSGKVQRAVINTHRTKLYGACRSAGVEFNHAVQYTVNKRLGHPSTLFVVRNYIEGLLAGQTHDFFQLHEAYGYMLSRMPDPRVLTRYHFVCRMLGTDPIHTTIEDMVEWHRCVSILSPQ